MNWEHARAVVWLRWRILANSMNRGGKKNAVISSVFVFVIGAVSIALFALSLIIGFKTISNAEPMTIFLTWGALTLGYFISGLVGIAMFTQRSSPLSLEKLMHLPVSPVGAFLSNFVSSLFSLSNVLFVPVFVGFSIVLIAEKGVVFAWTPFGILALVFMSSALFYFLQEWLASRITNKRTRGLLTALYTIIFVVCSLIPSVIGIQMNKLESELRRERSVEFEKLVEQKEAGSLEEDAYTEARKGVEAHYKALGVERENAYDLMWMNRARSTSVYLPPGWLPNGLYHSASDRFWPGAIGTFGMFAIGGLLLRQSYLQVTNAYCGKSGKRKRALKSREMNPRKRTSLLVSKRLPWVSEGCSAVAFMTIRTLLRSPEAKTLVTVPIALFVSLGSVFFLGGDTLLARINGPNAYMVILGVMTIGGLGLLVFVENQFNYEGGGFRSYILFPIVRKELLLGKNLAVFPLGLFYGILILGLALTFLSIGFLSAVGLIIQYATMLIIFALIGNMVSIYFSMDLSRSKLAQAKNEVLSQFLIPILSLPLAFVPLYFPIAFSAMARLLGLSHEWIYLVMSIVVFAIMVPAYLWLLGHQADQFAKREISMLEVVTAKHG